MRIALFLMAFTLGAGLAMGLEAADATSRHQQPQSQTVSVEVPPTPGNAGGPILVQPVRWDGDPTVATSRPSSTSGWTPGAGELVLATLAAGTLGAGVFLRRRVLVPVRV